MTVLRKSQAVTIRGVTFANAVAAARAHDLHPETVRIARKRGTLHRVGTGKTGVEPMRVAIRGQVFDSVKAAAAHFDVTPAAIYTAMDRGKLDRIGLPLRYNGATSKPISVGQLTFPSNSDADRALGFQVGFISKALRSKSKRGWQRILGAAMRVEAERAARERRFG